MLSLEQMEVMEELFDSGILHLMHAFMFLQIQCRPRSADRLLELGGAPPSSTFVRHVLRSPCH